MLRDFIPISLDDKTKKRLHFSRFPEYADFLLENRLTELAKYQLQLFEELNPPIFQYFINLSNASKIEMGKEVLGKLLTAVKDDKLVEYIENSLREWLNNQLPQISRNQIQAEDITIINLIRRKILRRYVAESKCEMDDIIHILNEIDEFTTLTETASFKILFSLNQNLFEQHQKVSKTGNWVWDLKKNQISWSKELYSIYELENVDITKINIAGFNHPEDAEFVKSEMEISRTTKQPHDFYYRIILPGNAIKTLHAKGQVITDESGEAEIMLGTLQDATKQKSIEEELRNSQLFLQKIIGLTPSITTVYNVKLAKFQFISLTILSLLGYDLKEMEHLNENFFLEFVHPQDADRLRNEMGFALKEANVYRIGYEPIKEFQYRLRRKDGMYRWFNTYASVFERDSESRVHKIINVSVDITEQINTHSLLREKNLEVKDHEERYFRMVNEIEDYAILRLSKEGVIENWNVGAEKIKGYKADDIIGRHFRIFYEEEDRKAHLPERLIEEATKNGKALNEGWRVRKDQTRFWGSVLITTLHDNNKDVVGFSKVTRDLTNKKIAEDNLLKYTESIESKNRELKEKNKELASFNYIASHDLQEPIRKIKVFISKIRHYGNPSAELVLNLDKISQACDRMRRLIDGLLLYCQGDILEHPDVCQIEGVLEEVVNDFGEIIDVKELNIQSGKLPDIRVNREQIKQVFQNIISNAIKYKKENASLRLRITLSTEARCLESDQLKKFTKIVFEDNGIGFDQKYATKIFELFQRLHNQNEYEGTGIGLAICKKIIENHQGDIIAEGQKGIGAKFTIYLPFST